jgi:C1A family cysteine protease
MEISMKLSKALLFTFASLALATATSYASEDHEFPNYDQEPLGVSNQTNRIYNLVPSPGRLSYQQIAPQQTLKLSLEQLPEKTDFSDKIHYIHNQLYLGSCSAQASTVAMEIRSPKEEYRPLSPLFVYWNTRKFEGTSPNEDSGATSLSDVIYVVNQWGACSEKLWPYDNYKQDFKKEPTKVCYEDALKTTVLDNISHSNVTYDLTALKTVLAQEIPVMGGVAVYASFESEEAKETGKIPLPKRGEKLLGGHAITFVGYNDQMKALKFVNSWGEQWGDQGCGYLPYAYFENKNLTMPTELWLIDQVGPKN